MDAPAGDPADTEAFRLYAAAVVQVNGPRVAIVCALLAFAWWPLDWLLYRGQPDVITSFAWLRTFLITSLVLGGLLLPRLALFEVHPQRLLGALAVVVITGAAYCLGRISGFDGPWFLYLTVAPLLGVLFPLPLRSRVVLALLLACGLFVGFGVAAGGGPFPEMASAASFIAFTSLASLLLGQLVYVLLEDGFTSKLRLERHDQHLRDLNENLEERVAEKALQVRRLAQHLETLREDERKWMAREIHDELGQELTALRFAVAVARMQAGAAGEAFDEIEALLDRTRATMRRILAALRPRVLDELGLVAGLDWLTKDVGKRTGVVIALDVSPPDLHLVGDGATTVFRIVQEALTNVARHASATSASVSVALEGRSLTVTVRDDGVGIDPDRRREAGLGLIGIRERADAVGGEARWTRLEGGGTEVWTKLPYPVQLVEGGRGP